eukprot:194757_1
MPTTFNPTTSTRTTFNPTTNSPTTNAPTTTTSPTTNAPTTFNPTTNSPTTNSPTTNAPTTFNPITGPLLIERCQRIWHYDNFVYNACPISDYTQELKCQYVTIPDTHIAESWYYDPNTFKSYKYKPSGQGITD